MASNDRMHAKFSLTQQKSRDLQERQTLTVDYMKQKMEDKFFQRDDAKQRVKDNHTAFI